MKNSTLDNILSFLKFMMKGKIQKIQRASHIFQVTEKVLQRDMMKERFVSICILSLINSLKYDQIII